MSSSLYWKPLVKGGTKLDVTTKMALHRLFGDPIPNHLEIGQKDIDKLLVATHFVEEPAKFELHTLIDKIREFGSIEITEEW